MRAPLPVAHNKHRGRGEEALQLKIMTADGGQLVGATNGRLSRATVTTSLLTHRPLSGMQMSDISSNIFGGGGILN